MKNGYLAKNVLACCVAAAGFGTPLVSIAQQESLALEEIVVTARKRSEDLQDVPVSVTALTSQLGLTTVRDLSDAQAFVPNLLIDTTPGNQGASISIRGISFQETDKSLDPPNGVILDGVYLGITAGAMLNNFDIERIEVLRGPQGTLFGKNTIGGAINVIRTAPTKELGGKVRVAAGDFGAQEVQGLMNMPLTENGGVKVFGSKIESDGYIENDLIGEDLGGADYGHLGATVAFDITEDFDIALTYEHIADNTDVGAWANFNKFSDFTCLTSIGGIPGAVPPADTAYGSGCMELDPYSDEDHSSVNAPNTANTDVDNANLTMNWKMGDWQTTAITGYLERDEDLRLEYDASSNEFLYVLSENKYEQFSQEIRTNGDLTDDINLTAGLYYWDSSYKQFQESFDMWYYFGFNEAATGNPAFVPGAISQDLQGEGDNESYAAFATVDWSLTERLTLDLGGRITWEEKTFTGQSGAYLYNPGGIPIIPQGPTRNLKDDWTEFSPRAALQYTLTDEAMVFGSYSNGFKSGGFFARTQDIDGLNSYDPEYVDTYEIGIKSQFWDSRMRLNATAFYSDYSDKQEDVIQADDTGAVGTVVLNASDVEISGLEIELTALLTEQLTTFANVGYIDSAYSSFDADLVGDGVVTDNSDLELRNTPEYTAQLGGTWVQPVSIGELAFNYNYYWRDKYQTIFQNDPLGEVDAGGFHNASIDLAFMDHYRVSVFGRNLGDERYARVILIPPVSTFGQWNEPRNYGVEFVMEF